MIFLLTIIPAIALALYAQYKVRSAYKKYSKVGSSSQMTGAQVARRILDEHGLHQVGIEEIRGKLSDHYDPRSKVVRLSSDNYHGTSLAGYHFLFGSRVISNCYPAC
jgi:Zn-dependent membrane protease YugP